MSTPAAPIQSQQQPDVNDTAIATSLAGVAQHQTAPPATSDVNDAAIANSLGLKKTTGSPATQFGNGPGETQDYGTKIEDAINNVENGVGRAASDAWGFIKGIARNSTPGQIVAGSVSAAKGENPLPAVAKETQGVFQALAPGMTLAKTTQKALPVIDSYEKARQKGASVTDAIKAADVTARQQDATLDMVQQRAKEFAANPTQESVRALGDITAMAGALWAGGEVAPEIGEGADVTPEAADTPETPDTTAPAPVTKATTPEAVASSNAAKAPISEGTPAVTADEAPTVSSVQPQLHQSIRDFVNKTAEANGLQPIPNTVPVTDAAQNLADTLQARSQDTFDKVEDITGVNPTTLKQQMAARADQITEAAAGGDVEKAGKLEQLQLADENRAAQAFNQAKAKGIDVEQARSDWNSSLRADELSSAVRGSKSGASTLKNPELDPSKLTPRLQKLAESQPGGKAPKIFQLGGEGNGTSLVESAEQTRGAINDFQPKTATGQKALADYLKPSTGTGKIETIKQSLGFKPTTNWIDAAVRMNKDAEGFNEALGADAPAARAFINSNARWQVGKMIAKGATVTAIGAALGVNRAVLHVIIGE